MTNESYDVIVVGAGGSGLAAACAAAEHGGRVLILERQPQPGGTTGIAVGSFSAACTPLQRTAGIDDDPAAHAVDVGKFASAEIERRNNGSLRRFFLAQAAETLVWLQQLGLTFVGPFPEPPNRQPRMHNVVPGAKAYIAALQLALVRAGAKLQCDAKVTSLVRDDRRVTGVEAVVHGQTQTYHARRGVILAAGDYANDAQLIAAHKGDRFGDIEGINPFATGDGQRLAAAAGAKLVNMDVAYGPELRFVASSRRPFQQWLPVRGPLAWLMNKFAPRMPRWMMRRMIKRLLVTWQHPEDALFEDGAILVDQDGRRFVDETAWPDREVAVARQRNKIAYILLDGRLMQRYSTWPHYVSTAPDIAYAYVRDYQRLRPDITIVEPTLEAVAAARGLNAQTLAEAIRQFNRFAAGESEDACGRKTAAPPLQTGSWVLLGPVKAYFTTTEGGAAINQKLQALDDNGEPIPGLYAVGQNGLGGMILWSHGLHIAWAMTSGRLAGQQIMQAAEATTGNSGAN